MCVEIIADEAKQRSTMEACTFLRPSEDIVESWRVPNDDALLWMRGSTTSYAVDPLGEYAIGVAERGSYLLNRGGSTHRVARGDLVVLDPSSRHAGSMIDGRPWIGRLLVIEEISRIRLDVDLGRTRELVVPNPVIRDPALARRFSAMHLAAEQCACGLEIEGALHELLDDVTTAVAPRQRNAAGPTARKAIRAAIDRIHDDIPAAIALDELASIAGVSRFTLVRQFKTEVGLPPHKYQIALRVQLARRLIDAGHRPADAAAQAGFTDQSHLTRHFRRMGMTPAAYARSVANGRRQPAGT
jgi:AraC-like DNA-binding protein